MARSAVMRWMASAMVRTWVSDSMTQGPAMRNNWPAPTCTGPISKEWLTASIVMGGLNRANKSSAWGTDFRGPQAYPALGWICGWGEKRIDDGSHSQASGRREIRDWRAETHTDLRPAGGEWRARWGHDSAGILSGFVGIVRGVLCGCVPE